MTSRVIRRIERPTWARPAVVDREDVTDTQFSTLLAIRSELLDAFDGAVVRYLQDSDLTFEGGDFPNWKHLTGAYYLSDEWYSVDEHSGYVVGLMAHCLQAEQRHGTSAQASDYLGLDVTLLVHHDTWRITERSIDSSSI